MPIRNQMRIVKVVACTGLLSLAADAGPIDARAPNGAGAPSYRGRNLESLVVERVAPGVIEIEAPTVADGAAQDEL